MLAAVWVCILRYIPDGVVYGLPWVNPTAPTP